MTLTKVEGDSKVCARLFCGGHAKESDDTPGRDRCREEKKKPLKKRVVARVSDGI